MRPETGSYKPGIAENSGLTRMRCQQCGHMGFIAGEGLHLVFRAGHEYCFTFGATSGHLTVAVTGEAVFVYQQLGLSQEMLARHAAEWLLLLGRHAGIFILSPDQPAFAGFSRYLRPLAIPNVRPHVA